MAGKAAKSSRLEDSMDAAPAWTAIAAIVVTNLVAVSFGFGQMFQRLKVVERLLNEHLHEHRGEPR